jgi:hypothetical protein
LGGHQGLFSETGGAGSSIVGRPQGEKKWLKL